MKLTPRNTILLLAILTLVKIIIIYLFFQHIVVFDGENYKIARAYAWGELVENMHQGEYINTSQYNLAHLYDFKFHALRPPVYAFWLYLVSLFGKYAAFIAVLGQSIVTSLIAFLAYKIVKLHSKDNLIPLLTLLVVFFLPMNFFKSGTLDDAMFMLLFLLAGMYYLLRKPEQSKSLKNYMLAGLFFGMALLTRPAALFPVAGILAYMIISRQHTIKGGVILILITGLVLSPWLIRNAVVIGKPAYTNGNGRILLMLQSDEFIHNYPTLSIDKIDSIYFTNHYEELKYINSLSEMEKDHEFSRLARDQFIHNPWKVLLSFKSKLKVFLPNRYYPHRTGILKNGMHIVQYGFAMLVFLVAIFIYFQNRSVIRGTEMVCVAVFSYASIGIIMILLSRHFYPLITMMLLYGGMVLGIHNFKKSDA